MLTFTVTVRTAFHVYSYPALAMTSHGAYMDAANAQGDIACGITVIPC
jgi:hypothetical protein